MINLLKKLRSRFLEFKLHPLTADRPVRSFRRYLHFNILNRIIKESEHKWIHGLSLLARRGDAGIVANIYFGLYEFYESTFVLHFLRENDLFFDIGANLGHYSLLASGVKGCKSIAVEPVPATVDQLRRQVELNKLSEKIEINNFGISDSQSELFFSTDRGTMNSIVEEDYGSNKKVAVKTVDDLVCSFEVGLMKIDVEGFEMKVLEGSSKTLENPALKAIIVEINGRSKNFGIGNEKIVSFLKEKNFSPYRYNPFMRKLIALDGHNREQFNTIFARDLPFVKERLQNSLSIKVFQRDV